MSERSAPCACGRSTDVLASPFEEQQYEIGCRIDEIVSESTDHVHLEMLNEHWAMLHVGNRPFYVRAEMKRVKGRKTPVLCVYEEDWCLCPSPASSPDEAAPS